MPEHRGMGLEQSRLNSQCPGLPPSADMSAPMLRGKGGKWRLPVLLSPERQCHLSQTHSRKYDRSLPMHLGWSSDPAVFPALLACFVSRSKGNVFRPLSQQSPGTSKTPVFVSCWLQLLTKISLARFLSQWLRSSLLLTCIPVHSTPSCLSL